MSSSLFLKSNLLADQLPHFLSIPQSIDHSNITILLSLSINPNLRHLLSITKYYTPRSYFASKMATAMTETMPLAGSVGSRYLNNVLAVEDLEECRAV